MSIPSSPAFRLRLVPLLITSALLGACSSSGGDDPVPPDGATGNSPIATSGNGAPSEPGGDVTAEPVETPTAGTDAPGETASYGTVEIDQPSERRSGSVSASFFRLSRSIPAEQVTAFTGRPALDTCIVSRVDLDSAVVFESDAPGFDVTVDSLSAGETITLTSPAGTWSTLLRDEIAGFVVYEDDEPTPPVPTGLTVDVPGDAFPAFPNVPIPDVAPLVGVTPASGAFAPADTTFRWEAGGGDPSTYVEIVLSGLSLPATLVDCAVRDDGEFTLPAAVREQLGADFSGLAIYSRIASTVVQRDGALLLLSNRSQAE